MHGVKDTVQAWLRLYRRIRRLVKYYRGSWDFRSTSYHNNNICRRIHTFSLYSRPDESMESRRVDMLPMKSA